MSNYVFTYAIHHLRYNCMCCNRIVEGDVSENPIVISPIYDGLIFRTQGNFGSRVFDPMPIDVEEILQVVICDECLKKKAKRVTHIRKIKREVTAEAGEFHPREG